MKQMPALSMGAVYEQADGVAIKLHYFSSHTLLVQRLDANSHPYRILRRSDGKLLGIYRERALAVAAWDLWFKDGSHA